MGSSEDVPIRLNYTLGHESLIAMNRNSVGYQTKRDIEKDLAKIAADAGGKVGDEIEYSFFVKIVERKKH